MGFFSVSFYRTYYYFVWVWIIDLINALMKGAFDLKYYEKGHINVIIELGYLICLNMADLFAGFFVLYTYKTSKSEKSKSEGDLNRNKSYIELIYNDLSIKENKYYLILFISILEFIARSTDFFYLLILGYDKIRDGEITWLISLDILSRILFSHFILKQSIYKHHILSIFLTLIGLCSMSGTAFIAINSKELMNWPYFIFISIKFIIFALEDVTNKILLINKFLLPQALIFWRGIYNFFMILVLLPIVYFTKLNKYQIEFDNKGINLIWQILLIIFIIPFSFLKSFLVMKVIYIFTPQHVAFLNVVFYMLRLLRCRIISADNVILISADVILLLIIIFSTLLFNEMIIINSCGLGENTKVGFLIKEEEEIKDAHSSQFTNNEDINKSRDSLDDKKDNEN